MDIRGRTALVTGGAAGIGRAAAVMLAAKGAAKVGVVDLDAVERWLAGAGSYDILYNNAGVVSGAPQFPLAGARQAEAQHRRGDRAPVGPRRLISERRRRCGRRRRR
jgi:3-oxoacyl-[acyl-carrier protein] reductase